MQPFRIRKDAREWFKDLREKDKAFRTDFDSFYFCFMAGVAAPRKLPASTDDTAELVDYFPDRYGNRGRLLVGLFLSAELSDIGIALTEKRDAHAAIARLVAPGRTFLSDDGVREFNKYAHGGYEVLLDWFDGDRPRTIETFLRTFKRKMDEAMVMRVQPAQGATSVSWTSPCDSGMANG